MNRLSDIYRKKRYFTGGEMELLNAGSAVIGGIQQAGVGLVDALDTGNKYGHQGVGAQVAKGAMQGGLPGAVVGYIAAKRDQRADRIADQAEKFQNRSVALQEYAARAAGDPSSVYGTKGAGYYANGGSLVANYMKVKAKGGSLQQLSSDTVLVNGPSHEQGGVDLPGNNEVEGGETIKGNYVMSERLGFAQLHKPIAKAIGQLEQKPPTAATINSLRRLQEKEKALMLLQEQVRQQNNLA